MDAIVVDDFTITFPNGEMQTKPQIMAALKSPRPAGGPSMKFRTEEVRPRAYGDVVVLVGIVVTEYQRDGKKESLRAASATLTRMSSEADAGKSWPRIFQTRNESESPK